MFKVNNKVFDKEVEVIEVAINKKTYTVPLAKYLPYKAIKKLRNKNDLDSIIDVLAQYIPMEVLEELTVQQLTTIIEAWGNASKGEDTNDDLGK
jgi:hypothetical protein